ncbi:CU044_5270 family protein [Streptomyces albicerus]|uniref:CU044_5270 family protein n=1 Tax=Streptomyces albicerus TaxID=2569859 RepID=UPI00124B5E1D|nr:CU044_5270 family protein [Streptomyces albicerus]
MDEMTAVRELRADAPAPSRARLAEGRDRLLRETRRGARGRRLRADWRFAMVGAASAITAAAVIGTQVVGDDGRTQAGSQPGYTLELGSAKGLLNEAADVIAARPPAGPRNGQWVYLKSVETNTTDDEQPGPHTSENWIKYADPSMEDGKAGDDHSPREQYAFLKSLPDDPERVRAEARAFFNVTDPEETRTQHEYRALTAIISRAYVIDPEGLAKVYRAMATIPGVQAAEVQDAAGRDAIALYLKGGSLGGSRDETLLDPTTYLSSGYRYLEGEDQVVISGARLAMGLVDEKGERP